MKIVIEIILDIDAFNIKEIINEIDDINEMLLDLISSIFVILPKKSDANECDLSQTYRIMNLISKLITQIVKLKENDTENKTS